MRSNQTDLLLETLVKKKKDKSWNWEKKNIDGFQSKMYSVSVNMQSEKIIINVTKKKKKKEKGDLVYIPTHSYSVNTIVFKRRSPTARKVTMLKHQTQKSTQTVVVTCIPISCVFFSLKE